MNVWLVHCSGGMYEDYYTYVSAVCESRELAELIMEDLQKSTERNIKDELDDLKSDPEEREFIALHEERLRMDALYYSIEEFNLIRSLDDWTNDTHGE